MFVMHVAIMRAVISWVGGWVQEISQMGICLAAEDSTTLHCAHGDASIYTVLCLTAEDNTTLLSAHADFAIVCGLFCLIHV